MMKDDTGMVTRGELAKRCGVGKETIRYYEGRGLLRPTSRSNAGYRLYDAEAEERLRFVKSAQSLGFTLGEIAELLMLRESPDTTNPQVRAEVARKLQHVQQTIRELMRIERELTGLIESCAQQPSEHHGCPILQRIEADET